MNVASFGACAFVSVCTCAFVRARACVYVFVMTLNY